MFNLRNFSLLLLVLLSCLTAGKDPLEGQSRQSVAPPEPLMPIPSARQLDWQTDELAMFIHFTVNTFTDKEWGDGTERPEIFNPVDLDADQWVRVARENGFKRVILTAKHHDGFCLWPSKYTDHSVERSPWREGTGDVVGALAEACQRHGIKLGLYLSPWDRHEPTYGDERLYNQYYLAQLRELLTNYGPIYEVWFDGAKGEDAKDMDYHFDTWWSLVRQLQPRAVMFSDEGPDVRWIGNERGIAGQPCWSMMDRDRVTIGRADQEYLNHGDMQGPDWVPGESDVSIRPGWFWHPDEQPKSVAELMEIYYKSVGRNTVLLLNVPPDDSGLIPSTDVQRLRAFTEARNAVFQKDFTQGSNVAANQVRGESPVFDAEKTIDSDPETYWATDDQITSGTITVDLGNLRRFNVVRIQAPIQFGQRVRRYHIEVMETGKWRTVHQGTTIGYKRLATFETVASAQVRVVIDDARACPLISEIGIHYDPESYKK
ncbi:MAG TPA: alpha-L-fucosidase [bacterium]|nr:alpha-L-fucosidase [bacterium]